MTELESLRSKLDLAVKALEPFAGMADRWKDREASIMVVMTPDRGQRKGDYVRLSLADFRLACSTLAEMRKT